MNSEERFMVAERTGIESLDLTIGGSRLPHRVKRIIEIQLERYASLADKGGGFVHLTPGNMLRTRFAARLAEYVSLPARIVNVERACAAAEIAHAASVFRDGDLAGRRMPALNRTDVKPGSVRVEDMLLHQAIALLADTENGRYSAVFHEKIMEICWAEAEQGPGFAACDADEEACLHLASRKTGPLFAFVGHVCGGDDTELANALEEAGYRIGTLYELASDAPGFSANGCERVRELIGMLISSAVECVDDWPDIRMGLTCFLAFDLEPVLSEYTEPAVPEEEEER